MACSNSFFDNKKDKTSFDGCRVINAGNSKGLPFLMIGPTEPYLRLLPKKFFEIFDIRYVEDYWHKDYPRPKDIDSLTIDKLVDDVEKYCQHLWPDKKVIVFAPSAVGIIALEWAKKYRNSARDVLGFGTPTTMQDLAKKSIAAFIINYYPRKKLGEDKETHSQHPNEKLLNDLVNKLGVNDDKLIKSVVQGITDRDQKYNGEQQTKEEMAIWDKFCVDVNKNAKEATDGVKTSKGCIAEYRRDELRYYTLGFTENHRKELEEVYKIWDDTFNIDMRRKFFNLMLERGGYTVSLPKNDPGISCFFALGITDGIVSSLDVVDGLPKWCDYHVFEGEAHVMMANNPEEFAKEYVKHLKL